MQATSSYLPGSQRSIKWAPEMLMLFWEMVQCNKRFRSFIVDSNRAHDFIIICIFYAIEYKTDPSKNGLVKMCIFLLQTLSVEPNFGKNLFRRFEAQDTLPPSIRLENFGGTYGDFLIIVSVSFLTRRIYGIGYLTDQRIVHPYAHYHQQREIRRRIPGVARHHQQCGSICPTTFSRLCFQGSPVICVNVCSKLPISQRDKPSPSILPP